MLLFIILAAYISHSSVLAADGNNCDCSNRSFSKKDTLTQLKKLYDNMNGQNWTHAWPLSNKSFDNSTWFPKPGKGSDDDYCKWFGIKCCDNYPNTVSSITLFSNNLNGNLPGSDGNFWRHFPCLDILSLSYNQIHGTVPPSIHQASSLMGLWIHHTQLNGTLPPELGTLTKLKFLRFDGNPALEGSIPNLSNLSKLELFFVTDSKIKGSIPGLPPSLSKLKLNNNSLDGTIPDRLSKLTNLRSLDLSHNHLQSSLDSDENWSFLPESWGNSKIQQLLLSHNQLNGTLPDSMMNLSYLTEFDVSHNPVDQDLTKFITPLLKKEAQCLIFNNPPNCAFIRVLHLSNCSLHGTVPQRVMLATEAYSLDFSYNNLQGSLPKAYGEIHFDTKVNDYTNFVIVPPAWSSFSVKGNRLINGAIPEEWGEMQPYQVDMVVVLNRNMANVYVYCIP